MAEKLLSKRENVSFKKNPNGSWQLVFNGSELGISFIIPDDCKIEDYNIKVSRQFLKLSGEKE